MCKTISLWIGLALSMLFMGVGVHAQTVTLFADSVQGNNGSQVVVPIRVNDFTNMIGMQGTVSWDTNIVQYDTVFQYGLPSMFPSNFGTTFTTNGQLTFSWDDPSLTGVTLADSGVVFAIRFDVVGSPGTQTPVSFVNSPTLLEFVNGSFSVVPNNTVPGQVEVAIGPNCVITDLQAGNQGACNPTDNTYTQEVVVTYFNGAASGTLDVNGQSFPITSSPQTVTLTGLISDGLMVNVSAGFSDSLSCVRTENGLFTAPQPCISRSLTIFADSLQGAPGTQVVVPVRVLDFLSMFSAQGTIEWDTSVAQYDTVFQYGLPAMAPANFGTSLTAGGKLTFSWDDPSLQGVTLADSAIIFAIRYDIVGAPGTQTPVRFVDRPTMLEFTDNAFQVIGHDTISGEIEVIPGVNCAILDLQAGTQGACNPLDNTYSQDVIVTYANPPVAGTLDINGQTFSIGTSPQTVTLTGLVSDGISVNLTAVFSDSSFCTYTEMGVFTAPSPCIVTDLTIFGDSVIGTNGQQVIVPVRVKDFIGMISTQGTIAWNTAVATYDTVFQYGLPAMSPANFGTALTPTGRLTFSWDDPSLVGVTVPDSTIIFAIRYDVVGFPGMQTPISFIDSPTPHEFVDFNFNIIPHDTVSGEIDIPIVGCAITALTAGAQSTCNPLNNTYTQEIIVTYQDAPATGSLEVNGQIFPLGTSPQTVTLTGLLSDGLPVDVTASFTDSLLCARVEVGLFTAPANCIGTDLIIFADSVQGNPGFTVDVPVRVKNFIDLIAAQGTVDWNTAIATYDTVIFYGLPNMSQVNFGTALVNTGKLTFSWDDPSLSGVTVPDSTIIFTIRYNVTGTAGQATPVSFIDTPTLLEFVDNSIMVVPYYTVSGEIEIPLATLTTDALAQTFYCAGDSILVPFTAGSGFFVGNVFTAELSDASGSFASPTVIGSLTGVSSDTIRGLVPYLVSGSGYRVRVVATNPVIVGTDNGVDLTISNIQDTVATSICSGDSILLGGAFQTAPGMYVDTLTAANSCDSIVTTMLTVVAAIIDSNDVDICAGDSILLGGVFQTTSGVYLDTLVASGGCDSIVTTTLTVLPNSANSVSASICDGDSILLGGAFQSTSGSYIDTLVSANGCDSVLTTVLTVLPVATNTVTADICAGDSIFLAGAFQTLAGTYVDTLIAANGCDSLLSTVLTVLPVADSTLNPTICNGDSLFAGGAFQTTTGTYIDVLVAANGCDSTVTTNLTVLPTFTTNATPSICNGDSLFVGGGFQTVSGTYTDTLTASNGCDSVVVTVLTVLPTFSDTIVTSICNGDSLFAGGAFQTTSGTYVDSLTASNGCDSVVTTQLTVVAAVTTFPAASICDGDSIFLAGAFQTVGGTYIDTLVASGGCDSIVTTTLTVLPVASNTVNTNICDGDSLFLAGAFQTVSGTYVDTLTAANGCDSLLSTVLTVLPVSFTTQNLNICNGDSLLAGGAFQTTSGTYLDTLTAANGCDSIITTNLTVLPTFNTNLTVSLCDGDSVFAGGAFQSTAGTYVDTLTAGNGCDSIVSTVVTILPVFANTVTINLCDGDSLLVGGAFQTTSGTYVDSLTASNGCDSIVTTQLTFLPVSTTTLNDTLCDGDSLFVGGAFQTTSGVYMDTLTAGNGCDSIITTNLTILPVSFAVLNPSICSGDSVFVGGAFQTVTGTYMDTLVAANGCDSIITTNLTVLPTFATNLSVSLCNGDSVFAGGAFQSTAGTYVDSLTAINGCDSIVSTVVTILPVFANTVTVTLCDGDSILAGGAFQTTSGTYVDSLTASNGCDSVVTTQLIVLPNSATTVNDTLCDGDSLFVGGAFQTTSGVYMDTLVAGNGCDSVITTNLTILPVSNTTLNFSICDGDSLFAAGAFQTVTGAYFDTLVAANGCDSIITTNLTVLPTFTTNLNVSLCNGDSLFAGGAFQSTAGTYVDSLTASNGCDSIVSTVVTILPVFSDTVAVSICDGESYVAGGAAQTTSGTYVDSLTASNGCDSVVTTQLTVLPVSATTVNDSICDGDSLFVGGAFQTTAGTYRDTLVAGNGCDSIVSTVLVILPNASSTSNYTICNGDSIFLAGAWRFTSGTFMETLPNPTGCDTILTSILVVNPPLTPPTITPSGPTQFCDGESVQLTSSVATSYLWSPNNEVTQSILVSTPGTYSVEITDANNCTAESAPITVIVDSLPVSAFSHVATGLTLDFTDLSLGVPTSWTWDFGDGNFSSLQNPTHTYAGPGPVKICLIAINSCGRDTSCQTINVMVGRDKPTLPEHWNLYPNPHTGVFYLEGDQSRGKVIQFSIFSMLGEEVIRQAPSFSAGNWREQFDLSGFSSGPYILMIETEKGIWRQKVIKGL